jgi:hypothetical protein
VTRSTIYLLIALILTFYFALLIYRFHLIDKRAKNKFKIATLLIFLNLLSSDLSYSSLFDPTDVRAQSTVGAYLPRLAQ